MAIIVHDAKINLFIPIAEQQANTAVAKIGFRQELRTREDGIVYNHCFWSEAFHTAMNVLTCDAGLRICR